MDAPLFLRRRGPGVDAGHDHRRHDPLPHGAVTPPIALLPRLLPLPFHVLPQGVIDPGLIALSAASATLEPGNDVGVDSERELLLHWPEEQAALRPGPIDDLGDIARIDLSIRQRRKRRKLGVILSAQRLRTALLHTLSFRAAWPCGR